MSDPISILNYARIYCKKEDLEQLKQYYKDRNFFRGRMEVGEDYIQACQETFSTHFQFGAALEVFTYCNIITKFIGLSFCEMEDYIVWTKYDCISKKFESYCKDISGKYESDDFYQWLENMEDEDRDDYDQMCEDKDYAKQVLAEIYPLGLYDDAVELLLSDKIDVSGFKDHKLRY